MANDKQDFTFMKSGFNNLVEKDETVENVAALILNFMDHAIRSAAIYIKHGKRNTITREDIKRGFMLEVFFMNKRPDSLENCKKIKKIVKEILETEEEEAEEEIEYEDNEDDFALSECTCAMCNCMNTIYERWGKWTPQTQMEIILHKHIENI
jgi:hypothetical protein